MDKIQHFEIPADDPTRAQKFYSDTFDWQIKKVPMPDMEYYVIHTTETDEKNMPREVAVINGGMAKREGVFQHASIVITVASLADALKKIENAGGKVVVPESRVGDMGLYARIEDTEGNVIGVWEDLK